MPLPLAGASGADGSPVCIGADVAVLMSTGCSSRETIFSP